MKLRPFLAATAALMFFVPAASAGTITVTSKADSGPGSIRQALVAANAGDTILVPAGTYAVTSAGLNVNKGITLRGAGARSTILRADANNRVLGLGSATLVTIEDLTVTNGSENPGGGILSNSPLTLDGVALVGNNASGGTDGGGLVANKSTTIVNSLIAHNAAVDGGGMQFNSAGT